MFLLIFFVIPANMGAKGRCSFAI